MLKALKFHILRDPDSSVRICALKTIEVNSESVKGIYNSTRDECISIRKTGKIKFSVNILPVKTKKTVNFFFSILKNCPKLLNYTFQS